MGVEAGAVADRFAGVRAALLGDEQDTMRQAAAQVAARREWGPSVRQAERDEGQQRLMRYAEEAIRSAGHRPAEEARLLAIVRADLGLRVRETDDVVRTEAELNPEPMDQEARA